MVTDKGNGKKNYILLGPNQEVDRRASTKIKWQLQKEFQNVLSGIGCFVGTFSLQLKKQ